MLFLFTCRFSLFLLIVQLKTSLHMLFLDLYDSPLSFQYFFVSFPFFVLHSTYWFFWNYWLLFFQINFPFPFVFLTSTPTLICLYSPTSPSIFVFMPFFIIVFFFNPISLPWCFQVWCLLFFTYIRFLLLCYTFFNFFNIFFFLLTLLLSDSCLFFVVLSLKRFLLQGIVKWKQLQKIVTTISKALV